MPTSLAACGLADGPGGVSRGQVEVFPKQNEITTGRFGNQFILPLAGQSVPLDPFDLDDLPREWLIGFNWPLCAPVPVLERPAPAVRTGPVSAELAVIRSALAAIPDDADCLMQYRPWLDIIHAIHAGSEGSDDGRALAHEFSQRSAVYDADEVDQKWEYARDREGGITVGTLFKAARTLGGWQEPVSADDFDDVSEVLPVAPVAPSAAISYVDFASLQHRQPPPRRWVLDQYIPRKAVTSMFGRGGHGKSLLAQQIAMCVAKGLPFAGWATTQGAVLGLFAEDDADEMLRRGAALYVAMGLELGDASGELHLDARAGKFNTLVSFTPNHMAKPTSLMAALRAQCEAVRPVLVILDNIAQLYAGEENNRHDVTAFCNELTGLACEFDCSVLLLGHVAKNEESEYSGSTAWDAAVRSRLLLVRQEDGSTLLRKVKANYSSLDEVRLEWRSGAFEQLPTAQQAGPEVIDAIKPYIIRALEVLTTRKQAASHMKTARNYLVKQMREESDLHASIRPELLEAALRAMLDAGEVLPAVELPWKNSSRHAVTGLALP